MPADNVGASVGSI